MERLIIRSQTNQRSNAFTNKLKSHNKLTNDFKFIKGNIIVFVKKIITFTFK